MVESKDSRSRFIPYKNNAVRFSVDAFLFKGMSGQVSKNTFKLLSEKNCSFVLLLFCSLCQCLCYKLSGFCLGTMLID